MKRFRPLLFSTIALDAPYCYRCPLHLRFPSCQTACLDPLEDVLTKRHEQIAGVIIEPMVHSSRRDHHAAVWLSRACSGIMHKVQRAADRR